MGPFSVGTIINSLLVKLNATQEFQELINQEL